MQSIADQSLAPTCITLVDDGVDDARSVEKLGKDLFGERFQLLENDGHGISAALNTAIRHSSAEWIARMDADDVAHPQRLQRQLEFLKAQADSTIGCGTQVRFINADGVVLDRSR